MGGPDLRARADERHVARLPVGRRAERHLARIRAVHEGRRPQKLGWTLTVIDGKGSPSTWVSGFNQAIALKPNGIAIFADAKSLQDPIRTAVGKGITVVGLHAASLPGPAARPAPLRQHPGRPARDRQGRSGLGHRRQQRQRQGRRRHAQRVPDRRDQVGRDPRRDRGLLRLQGARLRQLPGVRGGPAHAAADDELGPALRLADLHHLGRRQRPRFRDSRAAQRRALRPIRRS